MREVSKGSRRETAGEGARTAAHRRRRAPASSGRSWRPSLPSKIVPSPSEVWSAFTRGVSDGTIPEAAAKTLVRLAFSFVVVDRDRHRARLRTGAERVRAALDPPARRRAADHAVHRVAAARRRVVRVVGAGGGVRGDRRSVPVRDARHDLQLRSGAPAPHAGRTDPGRRRLAALSRGHLPGGASRLRRRARSGVGVRVEGPHGGRADHGRPAAPPDSDSSCSAPRTTCRCWSRPSPSSW